MIFSLTFTHHIQQFVWGPIRWGPRAATRPQELQKLRDEKLAAEKERKAAEVPCPDIFFLA